MNIDCTVAVLSGKKNCQRGELPLLHFKGPLRCSGEEGHEAFCTSHGASLGRECSRGRKCDQGSRQQSREDHNPPWTPVKGNRYCLQTGGGEREEAAIEKGRRRAKALKRQQVLENTHLTNLPNIIKKGWFDFQIQKWWLIRWALYLEHVEWIMAVNGYGKYLTKREKKIHKSYKAEHKNTNIPTFRESLNNNRLNLGSTPKKQGTERKLHAA